MGNYIVLCHSCGERCVHEADAYADDGTLNQVWQCSDAECDGGVFVEVPEPLVFTDSDFAPRRDSKKQPVGQVVELRITISNDGVLID